MRPHAYVESATVVCRKYQILLSCFYMKSAIRGYYYGSRSKNNNNNCHNTIDDGLIDANYPQRKCIWQSPA